MPSRGTGCLRTDLEAIAWKDVTTGADLTCLISVSIPRNSNTWRVHLCILSRKYFPIASVDREKSQDHNDIYFMAFGLKVKVIKIVEKVSGRGHYAMQ